jgi:hypothetical protein
LSCSSISDAGSWHSCTKGIISAASFGRSSARTSNTFAKIRLLNQVERPRTENRGRPRRYGHDVAEPLTKAWEAGDRLCGKLLRSVLPDLVAALERHGELVVTPEVKQKLLQASPSTIDRLLRRYKRKPFWL